MGAASSVVLPRKGKRLNPYAGLKYPKAGKVVKEPTREEEAEYRRRQLGMFTTNRFALSLVQRYVVVESDSLGNPIISNVCHWLEKCPAIGGRTIAEIPQNFMGERKLPTIAQFLDDCETCYNTLHQHLQDEITYCVHQMRGDLRRGATCRWCKAILDWKDYDGY